MSTFDDTLAPWREPSSTYRLQLNAGCTFTAAAELVPYLSRLGVTDLYASPYLAACPGSSHGYDITDHNALNPELGTAADYEALVGALRTHDMGQVLDFVPNHMGVDPFANPWWRDVLENGLCSTYARYFDIDWEPVKDELVGRILLPLLGDQYGRVLERGELRVEYNDGTLVLRYFDRNLPINPRTVPLVLRHDLDAIRAELTDDHPDMREFLSILTELQNLPVYTEDDPERITERHREKEVARDRLRRLARDVPRIREHIDRTVDAFNGRPGDPASFDQLHELLEAQPYRLSYWRTASHEINYRRFFDINELGGLRMEEPAVFQAAHALVLRLVVEGAVTGLRIDHPDGLFAPVRYFERLQDEARRAWLTRTADPAPDLGGRSRPLYLLAEKILSKDERLPAHWLVHGTTGYNFLNDVQGLFVDPRGERPLRRLYRRFTRRDERFPDVAYESKRVIMEHAMASELNVLAHALNHISEMSRRSRDFTLLSLRDALLETVACFSVYRTYVGPQGWTDTDRAVVDAAIREARRRNPSMESSIFDFLRAVLLPRREAIGGADPSEPHPPQDEADYLRRVDFAKRFQQYTAPVQAKGVEDTAFYRYNLLVSLNEVGGDPERFARSPGAFHAANQRRLETWPFEMTTTATHDTKLGEDVRTRIGVLSEVAEDWRRELWRWSRLNASARSMVEGAASPDRNDEYRFYQVLLGVSPAALLDEPVPREAPPAFVERLRRYMRKATKEAKVHTSWVTDNVAYDEATARFVTRCLAGPSGARFLSSFVPFARRVAHLGALYSLAQVTLRIAAPGVPDVYQGAEFWDLTLVDPDNRRPVDFAARREALAALEPWLPGADRGPLRVDEGRAALVADLVNHWPDGRLKLYVTATGLRLRRLAHDLFVRGSYEPLEVEMTVGADAVAFARRLEGVSIVAVVPRTVAPIAWESGRWPLGSGSWLASRLWLPRDFPATDLLNLYTGETVKAHETAEGAWVLLGDVFRTCPVALLLAGDLARAAGRTAPAAEPSPTME